MTTTGATLFLDALEQYGVTHLFGNPGTTELPIMDAISDSDVDYVLALHEDVAVGMASGYAKTRRWHAFDAPDVTPLGVVNLHVAPGLAHGLGNLFDSGPIGSGAPILVTAGAHATAHQHREPNLHGDLVRMADQFTKWSAEVKDIDALPTMLRRAARVALSPPTGPVFLALPFDVTTAETDAEPERLGSIPGAGDGDPSQIDRAVDAVADADDVAMIVGDGLARAGPKAVESAIRFAERAGTRVHGEFRSTEVAFASDHEQWAGRLPDERETSSSMMDAEALVLAGTISNVPTNPPDVPEGVPPGTTSIHVSDDAREIGKNYVADIGILGDAGRILSRLADRVVERVSDDERERRLDDVRVAKRRWGVETTEAEADSERPYASNAQLADAIASTAPDARIVAEATTSTGTLRRRSNFEPGQFFSTRGGGLGYGLPAAVGTAIAEGEHSDSRDVVGFIGDGAHLFYPNTLYTAVRYDVDLTVVVADNRNYRILKDNMLSLFGGEEDDYDFVGMDFEPPVDIATNAETYGASGRVIDDPEAIEGAISDAFVESGPTLLDVLIHD